MSEVWAMMKIRGSELDMGTIFSWEELDGLYVFVLVPQEMCGEKLNFHFG
jgi:hypothetical protein